METDQGTLTKQQILTAALRVFADSGYDGARMEQIAKTAGVNKSLIYYYFKSKQEIFDLLVMSFYDDLIRVLEPSLKPEILDDQEMVGKAFEDVFRFLESRCDLVSILFVETLKKGSDEMTLFHLVDRIFSQEMNIFDLIIFGKGISMNKDNRQQRMVTEFFTLIGPILLYVVLGQKWNVYFKTSRDELKMQFITALKATHVAHHEEEFRRTRQY